MFTAASTAEIGLFWKFEIDRHQKCSFTCAWCHFRPQNFNSYNRDRLVKIRRIALVVVVVVVVILFHRHAQISTSYFFNHNLNLSFAYPSGMLFLIIFVAFDWWSASSFGVFFIAALLSFTSFHSDSQVCVLGLFSIKQIIVLLSLAGYEMTITNSALCTWLVIYHLISSTPS